MSVLLSRYFHQRTSIKIWHASPSSRLPISRTEQRWGHSVRLIAVEDLPHGKGYKGDVVFVKAGYARNYLVPKKIAVYATPQNFEKVGIVDPNVETEQQRMDRLRRESSMNKKEEQYLKQSDLLKKYLKNKVLKLWRVVDPNTVDALHPGMVTAYNLRQKLSKQLKIDLEPSETIHICSSHPIHHAELEGGNKLQSMIDEFQPPEGNCDVKIKRLGEYVARISLEGGYGVPLKFVVQQRVP